MTDDGWVPRRPRPGTNLKGQAAGAAWTYLLDQMHAARVLCIGEVSGASLRTLRRVADHLDIVGVDALGGAEGPAAGPSGRYDIVFLAEPIPRTGAGRAVLQAAARWVGPEGTLWAEATAEGTLTNVLADAGFTHRATFWLTPRRGELRTAVPLGDDAIRRFFIDERVTVASLPRPLAAIEGRWPSAGSRRVGVAASFAPEDAAHRVPAYLRELARQSGVDLERHRIGLAARGVFSSRKVVAYLFAEGQVRPETIVKMTREPAFNERLENEERVLRVLSSERLVEPGTAPEVRFAGTHAGLRVLAQEALEGIPMTQVPGDAASVDLAYRWLIELGAASARRGPEAAAALRTAVEAVGDGVLRTYHLDAVHASRLEEAVATISVAADRLPTVLMHGDCALWNGWLRPDGRVAFLDWEAAACDAPPLWDLFSFAGSHVIARAVWRRRARRGPATVAALTASPDIRSALRAYCQRLDIAPELVAPLFSLSWGFRALREASRLTPEGLQRGRHVSLLRASLDPRVAEALEGGSSIPTTTTL